MQTLEENMVSAYFRLIVAGRRKLEDIPDNVPEEVKNQVKILLENDHD